MNSARSNRQGFKDQGCKDIGIRKLEFEDSGVYYGLLEIRDWTWYISCIFDIKSIMCRIEKKMNCK